VIMTMTPPIEPGTADQRIPSLTVPEPLETTPGCPATAAILSMTLRASAAGHSTWRLPVVAFGVIATIILDVTGGAVMMWHLPGDNSRLLQADFDNCRHPAGAALDDPGGFGGTIIGATP